MVVLVVTGFGPANSATGPGKAQGAGKVMRPNGAPAGQPGSGDTSPAGIPLEFNVGNWCPQLFGHQLGEARGPEVVTLVARGCSARAPRLQCPRPAGG